VQTAFMGGSLRLCVPDDDSYVWTSVSSKSDTPEGPLDLNALARFAAVVERGGFSGAARSLGLPRQSLHRSVAALEAAAGVRLLDRPGGKVRPTDAGQRLFAHATTILFEERAARADLGAARSGPRGRLRITAPQFFAEEFLMGPIQEFLAAWPEVRIEADLTVTPRDLLNENLDLAIRVGPRPTGPGWVRSLGRIDQICCAAPSFIAGAGALDDPRALTRQPMIFYGRGRGRFEWRFDRGDETLRIAFEPRLRVDNGAIALSACRAGLGVARLPLFACRADLASGSLTSLWPSWHVPSVEVWAYSLARTEGNPTLSAFVERVRARMATGRGATAGEKDGRSSEASRR
jgi:DNA-binding transcriptional LysR family regulator